MINRVRSIRFFMVSFVVIGGLVAVWVSERGVAQETSSRGYVFSDVEVSTGFRMEYTADEGAIVRKEMADRSLARITFNHSWEGPEFPGRHDCTFRVYDGSGSLIGESTETWIVLARTGKASVQVPVSGSPEMAEVTCSASRTDDPAGRWAFTDISLTNKSGHSVQVTADGVWVGAGDPAPQTCEVSITDVSGNVVATQTVNLLVADASYYSNDGSLGTVRAPNGFADPPAAANVSCRTFRG